MTSRHISILMSLVMVVVVGTPVLAQQEQLAAGERVARLVAEPARLSIEAGDTVDLAVSAFDAQGSRLSVAARFAFPRNAMRVQGATARRP